MRAVSWLLAVGLAALGGLAGMAAAPRLASVAAPVSVSATGAAPATARAADVLGARLQDPPADWPVRGCEVVSVAPGTTAASLGLVGARQRIDPVGDVIAAVQDVTAGGAIQRTPDCGALAAALAGARDGDAISVEYYHRDAGLLGGSWVTDAACGTVVPTDTIACPAPVTGTITPSRTGNRIQLQIELRGPRASATYAAVVDTGANETIMPDAELRKLGFTPTAETVTAGLVSGTDVMSFVYDLPSSAILVKDQGRLVPLTSGTVVVWGMPQESGIWLGPNILEQGAKLTTSGRQWTLALPCAP